VELVRGSLEREPIANLLRQRRTMFAYCVERELLKTPGLAGKLVLSWRIEKDGSLSHLEVVTKEHEHLALTACIASALRQLRFPAHGGQPPTVKVPFLFGP
jgi:hypothetical protein